MNSRRSKRRFAKKRHGRFEPLESRTLLHAGHLFWADTSQLTLSFAGDGTDIAGEPSALFETFNKMAVRSEWQNAILGGFQAWVKDTGSDIGVVAEARNLPFGTPGPRTRDTRFGDIRIGAKPLADNVKAIAVAYDSIVSGTWGGDVIFNSNADFKDLDEVFRVAMHEAGHVFGLGHSDDPSSIMFEHEISEKQRPAPVDVAGVQKIHGERLPDENEGDRGNDQFRTATPIRLAVTAEDSLVNSHLIYGDITTPDDVDVFRLTVPDNVTGAIGFELQTRGISLLAPQIRVTNIQGEQLGRHESHRVGGASVAVRLPDPEPGTTYYVQVSSADDTFFDVGGYSLITHFETVGVPINERLVSSLVTARERNITQDTLQSLLVDEAFSLDREVAGVDDIFSALDLPTQKGFELYSRYEALGRIADFDDVDYYVFNAFSPDGEPLSIVNLTVRSLNGGRLIPKLSLLNRLGNEVPSQTLVNGGGEVVIQARVNRGGQFYVKVESANDFALFDRGNYRLTMTFVEEKVELNSYGSGTLGDNTVEPQPIDPDERPSNQVPRDGAPNADEIPASDRERKLSDGHRMYVALPQLFHFILDVAPRDTLTAESVIAVFYDEAENAIHSLAAKPGETRTSHSILLNPGTYTIQVFGASLRNRPLLGLEYSVTGLVLSEPFGVDPEDPTGDAFFLCPGEDDLYCYPGGIETPDPFLWAEFLDGLPDIPDLELPELVATLLGDWWSWYWDQLGQNGPPLAQNDQYLGTVNYPLQIFEHQGVLRNDFDESELVAIPITVPDSGTLDMSPDGSFIYTPSPGFFGVDQFKYQAFDFVHLSNPANVRLEVSHSIARPGDFNDDDVVDIHDVELLCTEIRHGSTDAWFDVNLDQIVDLDDMELVLANVLNTDFGDVNLDGKFNPEDLIAVFTVNQYHDQIPFNSNWSNGDWNCNGDFESGDLVTAFQSGSFVPNATPAWQFAAALDRKHRSQMHTDRHR